MNITVYCGSSFGKDAVFSDEARSLGEWIGAQGHTLIYGGANVGLMGFISNTVLDCGGRVVGVMPDILVDREPPSSRLSEFHRVKDMAQRKALMIELGDTFVAMPGGPGTLEELSEIMSLVKIGLAPGYMHLLNIHGYYDDLVATYDRMLDHGFMTRGMRSYLRAPSSSHELIGMLRDLT